MIDCIMRCNSSITFNIGADYSKQFNDIFPRIIGIYSPINKQKLLSYSGVPGFFSKSKCFWQDRMIHMKASIIIVIKNYIIKSDIHDDALLPILQQVKDVFVADFASFPNIGTTELLDLLHVLANILRNGV